MYKGKTFLVIIPARGGSKGLPGKNIKDLNGKPLIAWSIEAAFGSKYSDEIMVTTDNEDIAHIATKFNASVPFLRPAYLATDKTTTFDAVKHSINFYKDNLKFFFDYIVLLEPTSPLRTSIDIDLAIEKLLSSKASAIVGICKTESQNPAFLVVKDSDNFISGYEDKDMKVKRRQDIKDVFFLEGSLYISQIDEYLKNETFYHEDTIGFEVPKYKSLEIDDIYDFTMIEAIMLNIGY